MKKALYDSGITSPIYVSIASLGDSPIDTAITNAQYRLVKNVAGIRKGVNTDSLIGRKFRYDKTHFNHYGVNLVSDLWVKCLIEK